MLLFIIFIFCPILSSTVTSTPECSQNIRKNIEEHLSTKTPYRAIANINVDPLEFEGCQATRLWSIIRHGSRNPSKKIIKQAKNDLMKLKWDILNQTNSNLCPLELERLQRWEFNVKFQENKHLVAEGEEELRQLAERMQKRLPQLLIDAYDSSRYYFKYTATQRTLKSAHSFAAGLFEREHIDKIDFPEPLDKDPVLRFYKLCNRWKTDVDKNPKTFDNVRTFLQGSEFKQALDHIIQKTQLFNSELINAEIAQLMYTICAFETAWYANQEPSIWCSFFDSKTIQVLEFAEDLEYYWNDGYGYDLTHRIACVALSNMFEYIEPSSNKPNVTFYFTHSGTMLKMLAHLGLYHDDKLTSEDFGKKRLWYTSRIDAFASNIAFVLYSCREEEQMVLVLHQERAVHVPGCAPHPDKLCSLDTLRKLFASESCNFHEICHTEL